MTREEQILNKAIDYSEKGVNFLEYEDEFGNVCDDKTFVEKAFIEGAKWADKTMIEKACEWLDINFPTIDCAGSWYKEGFIKQFKKAMEE